MKSMTGKWKMKKGHMKWVWKMRKVKKNSVKKALHEHPDS